MTHEEMAADHQDKGERERNVTVHSEGGQKEQNEEGRPATEQHSESMFHDVILSFIS
jgi:hypothetical protein